MKKGLTEEEAIKRATEKFKAMTLTCLGDWIRYGKALQIEFKPNKGVK